MAPSLSPSWQRKNIEGSAQPKLYFMGVMAQDMNHNSSEGAHEVRMRCICCSIIRSILRQCIPTSSSDLVPSRKQKREREPKRAHIILFVLWFFCIYRHHRLAIFCTFSCSSFIKWKSHRFVILAFCSLLPRIAHFLSRWVTCSLSPHLSVHIRHRPIPYPSPSLYSLAFFFSILWFIVIDCVPITSLDHNNYNNNNRSWPN